MRLFSALAIVVALSCPRLVDAEPSSRPRVRAASPDRHHLAEVRPRPGGGEALWLDGHSRWPDARAPAATITSGVSWSRAGDAVAFAARDAAGAGTLVVLVLDGSTPVTLSWELPPIAQPARAIVWLGPSRVGVGPAELQPRLAASWQTASAR